MADIYKYTGFQTMGFPDYRDLTTQQMLLAEPDGSYEIGAIDSEWPVPPVGGLFVLTVIQPAAGPAPSAAEKDEDS